jgi:hypothetical protein
MGTSYLGWETVSRWKIDRGAETIRLTDEEASWLSHELHAELILADYAEGRVIGITDTLRAV